MTDEQKQQYGIKIIYTITDTVFMLATAVISIFKSKNKLTAIWAVLSGKALKLFEGIETIKGVVEDSTEVGYELKDLEKAEYAELNNLIANHIWNIIQIMKGGKK